MALHVIVGAGPVGSATAALLVEQGHSVRVLTRSARGPDLDGIERVATDANDTQRLSALVEGAEVLYNCASPAYSRWASDWPALAVSILSAAEATGAVLVTMSNLYGYGPTDHPLIETDPLHAEGAKGKVRAAMWTQALAAHEAGRVRATEARASDYFGAGVRDESHFGRRAIAPLLRGRTVRVFGDPDVAHSWTYVPDIAATLVTLGTDARAWGRPWHVPTNPPMSQRAILVRLAQLAGVNTPDIRSLPRWQLRVAGLVVPSIRELDEVRYQFERPFVIDSSSYETTFGQRPTPLDDALVATVVWWRSKPTHVANESQGPPMKDEGRGPQ